MILRLVLLATAVLLGMIAAARAQGGAHGDGHAEGHDWYRELKQPGTGYSCCNGSTADVEGDCRPMRAVERADGWYALIEGEGWVLVPPAVILSDEKNRAPLEAHGCRSKSGTWYCFLRKRAGG